MISIFILKSDIHQLQCPDCSKMYTGRAGRSFYQRFNKNFKDYKYHNGKSKFAQHLLDNGHNLGPTEGTTNIISSPWCNNP
jgi:D-Tyr-tRNAtyr deacylase